jgi:uncharacterized membrane protein
MDPRPGQPQPGPSDSPVLEVALAHVLQLGTNVSIALIFLGSVLLLASGGSPLAGGPPLTLDGIASDVAALRPGGFLWLGIVGVLSTPALRVVRAMLGFSRRGERRLALVALLVLAVISVGVVVGFMAR